MKYFVFVSLSLFCSLNLLAQRKVRLPHELNEISGLEKFNDTILVAVNDSGNSSDLFFIDLKGKILKKCIVVNATNTDWEDLAMDDKGFLYIGDVGNNLNKRLDLCIWKVDCSEAFRKDSVGAEKIMFSYADQSEFPPNEENLRFDCEAIYWMNDSLHLITKNQSKRPGDRLPDDYVIPDDPGTYRAQHYAHETPYFQKVKSSGIRDLVTAGDFSNGMVAILTYSELRTFRFNNSGNNMGIVHGWQTIHFAKLEQREGMVILSEGRIAVASEKHPLLGGPFLSIFTLE